MHKFKPSILIAVTCFLMFSCGKDSKYPTEKRFWTPEDYGEVVREIEFTTPIGEQYPAFSNAETALVVQKLIDQQNYEVILDDSELGLNYKSETASNFFDQYRTLIKVYSVTDKQDNYVYPEERVAILKFGLGLQIKYFKLGNDRMIEQSDSESTRDVASSNVQAIIGNFNSYLDNINDEKHYKTFAPLLAEGINIDFFKLIEVFPNGKYKTMLTKANLMLKKTQVVEIREALTKLITKLESMQVEPAP